MEENKEFGKVTLGDDGGVPFQDPNNDPFIKQMQDIAKKLNLAQETPKIDVQVKHRLGIDLSTTNTGIIMLDEQNNIIYEHNLTFQKFSEANWMCNLAAIDSVIKHINTLTSRETLKVGIELSNFGNPQANQKFALYSGAILATLWKYDLMTNNNVKMFNSNPWQRLCGMNVQDTREVRKLEARQFAKLHCDTYNDSWTEDLCDAYCIAYQLHHLNSSEDIYAQQQNLKKHKKRQSRAVYALTVKLNNRYSQLNKLDPIKNKKARESKLKEIERLQQEIKFWKSKDPNQKL